MYITGEKCFSVFGYLIFVSFGNSKCSHQKPYGGELLVCRKFLIWPSKMSQDGCHTRTLCTSDTNEPIESKLGWMAFYKIYVVSILDFRWFSSFREE
jgi:hypothetical protein